MTDLNPCPRCRKTDCPTLGGSRWTPAGSMEAWRSCALNAAKRLEAAEAELTDCKEHFDAIATELKIEWNARVAAEATLDAVRAMALSASNNVFSEDEARCLGSTIVDLIDHKEDTK